MKYSTSILATVVACAYVSQARAIGDETKATEGAKEKGILNMDFDEGYGPYNAGYGGEDNFYFYPGREGECDYGREEERPTCGGYEENCYSGCGCGEESDFFGRESGCGCEGERHRSGCGYEESCLPYREQGCGCGEGGRRHRGCERGGHEYGFGEGYFPCGDEGRGCHRGRHSRGYAGGDGYEEIYFPHEEEGCGREGGRHSCGFGGGEYGFGGEEYGFGYGEGEEEESYSPYGEEDYEEGYSFGLGYPHEKLQRGPRYFESSSERERKERKEREERERKDFQKYKDLDAHKKEFEIEDDKRFLELGYGYDRGIKYNKGYGYTKSFNAEHEDRFDDVRFNREDAERKDFIDAREFEHFSNPREAEQRRYYDGGRGRGRHGRHFIA